MSESNINVTPGNGGPNIDLELVDNGNARQVVVIGDPTGSASVAPVDATLGLSVNVTNATSPLPSGAATSAHQVTGNNSLSVIVTNTTGVASATNQTTTNALLTTIASNTTNSGTPTVSGTVTANAGSGTFAVSATALPLPTGASTSALQTSGNTSLSTIATNTTGSATAANQTNGNQQVQGNVANAAADSGNPIKVGAVFNTTPPAYTNGQRGDLQIDNDGSLYVSIRDLAFPSTLGVTATGASGAAVTATLPAVAGQLHLISFIEITKIFAAANAASATPLVVTSTNLPGNPAWSFGQPAGAIGVTDDRVFPLYPMMESNVANTASTIVCPATTGIIWRVNVNYSLHS